MVGRPSRAVVDRARRKHLARHRPDVIIIDLKNHIMGRAAAVIAKQLLLGKKITVVRCDHINIAGSEIRNKVKYLNYLRKQKVTNPKKGPFHHRSPSDIFCRVVRNMIPRYTKRGASAMRRLVAYESIPPNVARKGARAVIPKALRSDRLRKDRAYTVLGEMCQHIGWKYKKVVDRLENARKERSARYHKRVQPVRNAWKAANKSALGKVNKVNLEVLKKFNLA